MNSKPVVVSESDALEDALRTMHRTGVRRLPVVGRSGELTGVVSIDDVLKCLASDIQSVVGAIRNEQQIEGVLRS
jgi:CBS domain-containing protein